MAKNRTFTMLKPDAVENGNIGAILELINTSGFRIVAMKLTQMSRKDAETFYAVHNERPFFWRIGRIHDKRTYCCCCIGKR